MTVRPTLLGFIRFATELIDDAVKRVTLAMKEGRFTREDLEMIKKIFQKAIEATDRAIEGDQASIEFPKGLTPRTQGRLEIHSKFWGIKG